MNVILGLDPGTHTGAALFMSGKLEALHTIDPHRIPEYIRSNEVTRVIFEDSRLTSFTFTTAMSRPAALKIARNVGEIDAWCKLIVLTCGDLNIPCHGISPKGKGKKLNAAQFEQLTGWTGRSNEHERDAATVAWHYRRAAA